MSIYPGYIDMSIYPVYIEYMGNGTPNPRYKRISAMTLTINHKQVQLSEDEVDNLFSDLSDLSIQIETLLSQDDRTNKAAIELVLNRLNLLSDVYS